MFYAHFVLSKKGPLARIWLAAHWDKKLTKAHVFETNIDSSVEAILKPKVKMALRTSGHLLLGVVRIYSRKAKYLLADCNEAFVKIKMAFRPGVVDLPEENREAAVAAITLQENFHDFETTLADLEDLDVQAQFSVNQSRPEEITMREDYANITLLNDDGFGDVGGFDEREILRDQSHVDDPFFKPADITDMETTKDQSMAEANDLGKPMDIDLPQNEDGFGDGIPFMSMYSLFFDNSIRGLFEDAPSMQDVPMAPDESMMSKKIDDSTASDVNASALPQASITGLPGEQTTLVHNEEEAFALEPLDVTAVAEKKGKRKRKLIVDEQKGIPSETMKLQLSVTSDIVTTLDLAPPTKKLMHWKETGGVEKLFALPGRPIISRVTMKHFGRNLVTKPVKEDADEERLDLESTEIVREDDKQQPPQMDMSRQSEMSTIVEEPSINETSRRSRRSDKNKTLEDPSLIQNQSSVADQSTLQDPSAIQNTTAPHDDIFGQTFNEAVVDLPNDPMLNDPNMEDDVIEGEVEGVLATEDEDEQRWSKRTQVMQRTFDVAFKYNQELSFKEMARKLDRKQAASRFYTLLVLKKHQAITVEQMEPYGDILIGRGPHFGITC
ncbi:hypothetical protein LOTGIDRAFT_133906 [Lottia gigantea]|uniref:Rad21/Rec8-like protein N-terminal domain-containing protein n=1 Tax=Lottia gigantea TaxID=225164 RepID=V3ZQP8_LOTGI|nr:hypothetical protein LOTGIDRAFT_133906 [Lottia gigantea]ESO83211.1 hypothetical protein LOTGIDRAFT_133906 [Lottia gigantea]